jgi:hypothetical protein
MSDKQHAPESSGVKSTSLTTPAPAQAGGPTKHQSPPDTAGAPAQAQPTPESQATKSGEAAPSVPDPAESTVADADTGTNLAAYESGWDYGPGAQAALLNGIVYVWWLFIGGSLQIMFGSMYLGTPQETDIHALSTPWLNVFYAGMGAFMILIGFGLLRLERWAWWAGLIACLALGAVTVTELVRWATGTPITLEVAFFAALDTLFVLCNIYLLSQTKELLRFPIFKGSSFAPGLALVGVALGTFALSVTLVVTHIDKSLKTPALLLVYLLGFALVIVMSFMAVKMRSWVWWADLVGAAILTVLSIWFIADQVADGGKVDTEGIVVSAISLAFVAIIVLRALLLPEVRKAILGVDRKQPLFSPRTLIGGLSLAVLAPVIYLLSGDLGTLSIAYTVFGLTIGAIVGLLPGADPANRLSAYFVGLLIAFASYVVRGGLLPYTKNSAALVVLVMLLIVTGITAVVRSRAWFVLMLLGVGAMYGTVEPQFQLAPSGYLASAGLALAGVFLGFCLGFTVSNLLQLELVPYKPDSALAAPATDSTTPPAHPSRDSTLAKAGA